MSSIASATFANAPNRLLTPHDAGVYFGVHPKTVIRLAREGDIPAIRLGKQWRFRSEDLEAWSASHVNSAGQPVGHRS